ncbi:MAG: S41 family peptidase [Burkholderiaceae bacterium]
MRDPLPDSTVPLRPRPSIADRLRRAACAAAASLAAACGGGGSTTPAPIAVAPATPVEWVRDTMADVYLYADRLPKADLSAVRDAAGALAALRVDPPDRFSYIEQRERYDGFFDEGRALGFGIGYRIEGGRPVLRFVQPESPAGRAGLRRGDRIIAIDGVDPASLPDAVAVSDALGPTEAGVVRRFAWLRDGVRSEATVTKDWYTVAPVLATRVIERAGSRIGYVALYTFTEPTRQAWADAIATIRAAGARTLIVDLRENGGGRLYVAADVAGSLAPTAAVGQTFTELRHNARHVADDLVIPMPRHAATGGFDRVVWLVSGASCSASESLIAGLRPFRDDPVIGTATCGKPVGFEPRTRDDLVLSVVSFTSRNRDGLSDWFDGLAPTCTVADEPYVAFGDERDPRLAEALQWLGTGRCSPSAAKSAGLGDDRLPRAVGLAAETGLY